MRKGIPAREFDKYHEGEEWRESFTFAGIVGDRDAAGGDVAALWRVRDVAEGSAAGQGVAHFQSRRHVCIGRKGLLFRGNGGVSYGLWWCRKMLFSLEGFAVLQLGLGGAAHHL